MTFEIFPWKDQILYPTPLERRRRLPPDMRLFGVETYLDLLLPALVLPEPHWLISIEGPGGIGKTALVGHLLRQPEVEQAFVDIAWVNARQLDFSSWYEPEPDKIPALSGETLIDIILEQINHPIVLARPPQEKQAILSHLLKQKPYLVVIDNLETPVDTLTLLPLLRRFANPTKFLLTSRCSLQAYPDVFYCPLEPLSRSDTLRFLHSEAKMRGIPLLSRNPEVELNKIYEGVGGNPLALQLVIGQMSIMLSPQVFQMLKQIQEKSLSELYTYIYWQMWQALDETSRQALLVMPLANGGVLDQLLAVSGLEQDALYQALQQLLNLSLIRTENEFEVSRYTIHRLTETFLLHEVLNDVEIPD